MLGTPEKVNKGRLPWWHHNSATIFRTVRQCMGLMMSQLRIFEPGQFSERLWSPKLILLLTDEGWSAQPYFFTLVEGKVKKLAKQKSEVSAPTFRLSLPPHYHNKNSKSQKGNKRKTTKYDFKFKTFHSSWWGKNAQMWLVPLGC